MNTFKQTASCAEPSFREYEARFSVSSGTCAGLSFCPVEPGSCRDIRASTPLIAWAIEQPCAMAAVSPWLMQWIDIRYRLNSRTPECVRKGVVAPSHNLGYRGAIPRTGCQSKASKTTTKTQGPIPWTLDSQNGFNERNNACKILSRVIK